MKKIPLMFLAIILAGAGVVFGAVAIINNSNPSDKSVTVEDISCPADAKVCPDGSAVGRTGADCIFAACPVTSEPVVGSPVVKKPLPVSVKAVKNPPASEDSCASYTDSNVCFQHADRCHSVWGGPSFCSEDMCTDDIQWLGCADGPEYLGLLEQCPDEHIQDFFPVAITPDHPGDSLEIREYYVLDGVRREISEFDPTWVKANCVLETQKVY